MLLQAALEAWNRTQKAREALPERETVYLDRFDQPRPRPECLRRRDQRGSSVAVRPRVDRGVREFRRSRGTRRYLTAAGRGPPVWRAYFSDPSRAWRRALRLRSTPASELSAIAPIRMASSRVDSVTS